MSCLLRVALVLVFFDFILKAWPSYCKTGSVMPIIIAGDAVSNGVLTVCLIHKMLMIDFVRTKWGNDRNAFVDD